MKKERTAHIIYILDLLALERAALGESLAGLSSSLYL
jgi:hypothetical protein